MVRNATSSVFADISSIIIFITKDRNVHKILAAKRESENLLGRRRRKWEND